MYIQAVKDRGFGSNIQFIYYRYMVCIYICIIGGMKDFRRGGGIVHPEINIHFKTLYIN